MRTARDLFDFNIIAALATARERAFIRTALAAVLNSKQEMPERGNFFLLQQHLIAAGAMRALREARFRTSSGNRLIDDIDVPEFGRQLHAAYGADLRFRTSRLGTFRMPESRFKLRTANGTSLRRYARRLGAESMTFCRDLLIRRIVAAGTGIVSVPADPRTRCRLCLMVLQIMAESCFEFRTAYRTSLRRQARCSRTRHMTFCGDLLIRRIIAAGTGIVSIPADLRASGRLRLMML